MHGYRLAATLASPFFILFFKPFFNFPCLDLLQILPQVFAVFKAGIGYSMEFLAFQIDIALIAEVQSSPVEALDD